MTVSAAFAYKLAKLVRILSSDKPGEVQAAVTALQRMLGSVGLDIHSLAAIVEHGLQHQIIQNRVSEWRDMACWLDDRGDSLQPHERDFVAQMADGNRGREPTDKQLTWLVGLFDRLQRRERGKNAA